MDHCRVCGFDYGEPWGSCGDDPTYEFCSCCGAEFGYEDCTIKSTKAYRAEWLAKGAPWFRASEKPFDWDIAEQLKGVPERFKDASDGT